MILVTGATGQLGSSAINHLISKGVAPAGIAALVRDEAKAEDLKSKGVALRTGDYTDYDSLVRAFAGVTRLLLVSSNDRGSVENRAAQHINAIKAAKEAGVKHVVYTSFVRKQGFETSAIADFQGAHVRSEEVLISSGIEYTILQNGIYLEMIPIFAGAKVAETGVVMYPAQDGKATWTLRDELAEAAAHVLTTPGHEGKTYTLTNTQSASFAEIAKALSGTLGKDVQYTSPSVADFEATMTKAGVPAPYVGMFTMWAGAQAEGALDVADGTLANFLGRNPTTVEQFVKQVYGAMQTERSTS